MNGKKSRSWAKAWVATAVTFLTAGQIGLYGLLSFFLLPITWDLVPKLHKSLCTGEYPGMRQGSGWTYALQDDRCGDPNAFKHQKWGYSLLKCAFLGLHHRGGAMSISSPRVRAATCGAEAPLGQQVLPLAPSRASCEDFHGGSHCQGCELWAVLRDLINKGKTDERREKQLFGNEL